MQTIKNFLADVYSKSGYVAVLIVVVTVFVLVLATVYLTGISLADVAQWLKDF